MIEYLINLAMTGWNYPIYRFFLNHIPKAGSIQEKRLKQIIEANKMTQFGKKYQFESLSSVSAFKAAVPIMDYKDYLPWIEKISDGQEQILTQEKVLLMEPTSGTTQGSKLIPYTKSLKTDFQIAIKIWLGDLFWHYSKLKRGKSYWSISPLMARGCTKGGLPIGFEDDTDYFGWQGLLIKKVLAVPPSVKKIKEIENFRYVTSYFLLKAENLGLISVWNPTFFILILAYIREHLESLIKDIHDGTLSFCEGKNLSFLTPFLKPAIKRAKELDKMVCSHEKDLLFPAFWKKLNLISCWQEGVSALCQKKLAAFFPETVFQGKGLLATEGVVTIPIVEAGGCIPAYTSHFLEFLAKGEKDTRLINELEPGRRYSVIITTGGGLYRYNLRDVVEVSGFYQGLPVISFVGKEMVSDLVGEKLDEIHVYHVLQAVIKKFEIDPAFMILSPDLDDTGGYYTLFIQPKKPLPVNLLSSIAAAIDDRLRENFHYDYARDLGQLKPIQIFVISQNGEQNFLERCRSEGQKLGDIKPSILDKRHGWQKFFQYKSFP